MTFLTLMVTTCHAKLGRQGTGHGVQTQDGGGRGGRGQVGGGQTRCMVGVLGMTVYRGLFGASGGKL